MIMSNDNSKVKDIVFTTVVVNPKSSIKYSLVNVNMQPKGFDKQIYLINIKINYNDQSVSKPIADALSKLGYVVVATGNSEHEALRELLDRVGKVELQVKQVWEKGRDQ